MPYSVPFTDFLPPDHNTPWTHVRIEESAAVSGPWTEIQVIALEPQDSDPHDPMLRSFTATTATLAAGWYRVTFLDAFGGEQPTGALFNGGAYTPSLRQVAAYIRARTTESDTSGELGTFTPDTRPTAEEAGRLIQEAADLIRMRIPENVPADLEQVVRTVTALQAAILIEISYFPEQTNSGYSPIEALERRLEMALEGLDSASNENQPGTARYGSIPITSPTSSEYGCCTDLLP